MSIQSISSWSWIEKEWHLDSYPVTDGERTSTTTATIHSLKTTFNSKCDTATFKVWLQKQSEKEAAYSVKELCTQTQWLATSCLTLVYM
jgi:hypothetical protein